MSEGPIEQFPITRRLRSAADLLRANYSEKSPFAVLAVLMEETAERHKHTGHFGSSRAPLGGGAVMDASFALCEGCHNWLPCPDLTQWEPFLDAMGIPSPPVLGEPQ